MKKILKNIIEKYNSLSVPLKASLFFMLSNFIQKGISIITAPIFTRLLSVTEYGQYTLYNSWMDIFSIFITLKLTEAVFNKSMVSVEDNEKRKVLSSYQFLITVLSICFTILYFIVHKELNTIIGLPTLLMIAMLINIFFDGTIKLWMAFQRYEYKYISLIVASILISILNPTIGVIAVLNLKNKVFGRILGIILTETIIGVAIYKYNIKKFDFSYFKRIGKNALLFNLPLLPHYFSQILLNHADRIMIGKIKDESQVALYGVAYTIGMLITLVTQSINNAYVPSMYRDMKKRNISKIIDMNYKLVYLVFFMIIIVFLLAPEVILILGGEKYFEATYAIYPIAASVLFIFIYTLYANIELYYGEKKYVTLGTCVSAILNIILNYIFITKYGYIAAAYTTLFCYLCYGFFHIFISKKIIKEKELIEINFNIRKIILMSFVLIIVSILLQFLIQRMIIRYILVFLLTILFLYISKNFIKSLSTDKNIN